LIATQPSISTLKRGRDPKKALVRRNSTQIRNQKELLSSIIALRGIPLLSIARKNLGNIYHM
jgi:hypothetical protein